MTAMTLPSDPGEPAITDRREDRDLVIVCPPGPARRVFELAGIDDLLAVFDSRDQAAASLKPPT